VSRSPDSSAAFEYLCVRSSNFLGRQSHSQRFLFIALSCLLDQTGEESAPDQNPNFPFWFFHCSFGTMASDIPVFSDLAVLHPKQVIEGSVLPAQAHLR